jgi:hypothetical protein
MGVLSLTILTIPKSFRFSNGFLVEYARKTKIINLIFERKVIED